MSVISIRERGLTTPQPVIVIEQAEYPLSQGIKAPFSPEEERLLEWYFEEYVTFPLLREVEAQQAARSIKTYGEELFRQLLNDPRALRHYQAVLQREDEALCIEVVGSPDFHRLHWEALKDPNLPVPLSLQVSMVRRTLDRAGPDLPLRESPTLNILVVVARPGAGRDVGYRTVSRTLVEALTQAKLRVSINILRPGTRAALQHHLQQVQTLKGPGHYHVVHFDVHGALLTYEELRRGFLGNGGMSRPEPSLVQEPYEGQRAYLFLEGDQEGQAVPIEASEVAGLLRAHHIPIAILNACQSGKHRGASESSLGSQLMRAGVQLVLAMGYSVTTSAVERLMTQLYTEFFKGRSLGTAIREARRALYLDKQRLAFFNQHVDLEDWLLPVVYQNQQHHFVPREFTGDELHADAQRSAATHQEPKPPYGFVGRDLDILRIERKLLMRRNLLLVQGMAGAGKSTLLHHLGAWWQVTGMVDQVFYFGYDERQWTRHQILDALGRQLFGERHHAQHVQPLSEPAQQTLVVEKLRTRRHLLILDNLESITGAPMAIPNTLTALEQQELQQLLMALVGGETLVLLGSRGEEGWLAPGTFEGNLHPLAGLDEESATILAERILARYGTSRYLGDPSLQRLLTLLDGYPLALEVVLSNLQRQSPTDILEALETGLASLELHHQSEASSERRTRSLLACIGYSQSNLSRAAQVLLLCLAPFTGVIHSEWLRQQYSDTLRQNLLGEPLLFGRWDEVLVETERWGLITRDSQQPMYLRMQPILPYFLRSRLREQPSLEQSIERSFRLHYDVIGEALTRLLRSREPAKRQTGLVLARMERENLLRAVHARLREHEDFHHPFSALFFYLKSQHAEREALALCENALDAVKRYPPEKRTKELALRLVEILGEKATLELHFRLYDDARSSYEEALKQLDTLPHEPELFLEDYRSGIRLQLGNVAQDQMQWTAAEEHYREALRLFEKNADRHSQALVHHQLGKSAQGQRLWSQAQEHYRKALDIKIDLNDRYGQASTYHNLGTVVQEQRNWNEAETYYREALKIREDFNDRLGMAATHLHLGSLAYEQRNWKQAEAHYQASLSLLIALKDRHSQARVYHHLGMVAQAQQQLTQAQVYYERALEILRESKDHYSQSRTHHQLGILAQEQRRWTAAEKHYLTALDMMEASTTLGARAPTYHQLGRVAEEQQHWAQAEEYYRKALDIFIQLGDRYPQARTYHHLGMVAQAQQQWRRARECFENALQILVDFDDSARLALTIQSIALLWRQCADEELVNRVAPILGISPLEARQRLLIWLDP